MIYVAVDGNDSNDGLAEGTPVATLNHAKTLLAGVGLITMLGGTYRNEACNVSGGGTQLTISAKRGEDVSVVFGEAVTSFTLHSGTVWKAAIEDAPHANTRFVFVWGESKQLSNRTLPHYPLAKAASVATVANVAGSWFVESGFLYVRMPNSLTPNGKTLYVPSATETDAFIHSGSGGIVVVNRINSFFGFHGFDFSGLRWGAAFSCLGYGNVDEGCMAESFVRGDDTNCEWACGSNDGIGLNGPVSGAFRPFWHSRNPWVHDCYDKGISPHYLMDHTVIGGVSEYNAEGVTPYAGAVMTIDGLTTRGNPVGIDNFGSGVTQPISVTNWTSENDTDAFANWAEGEATPAVISNSSITGATRGLVAVNAESYIESTGTVFTNVETNVAGYTDNITLLP